MKKLMEEILTDYFLWVDSMALEDTHYLREAFLAGYMKALENSDENHNKK